MNDADTIQVLSRGVILITDIIQGMLDKQSWLFTISIMNTFAIFALAVYTIRKEK